MAVMFMGTRFQSFKSDGTVNNGGTVEFYDTGTSTHKTTYSDSALTVANTWPVTLNSAGAADIWYSGDADVTVKDSTGTTIDTFTSINPSATSTAETLNLIQNGSFEDYTGSTPTNWDEVLYTGGTGAADSTTESHGAYGYKLTSTGSGGGYLTTTAFQYCGPTAKLVVGFDIKSSVADVRNVVDVLWYDADEVYLSATSVYDNSTTNPTSWTRYYFVATPPASARKFKVRLYGCHSSDATAGNTTFDNIFVIEDATITSSITIAAGGSLTFEGTTDDAFETTVSVIDPTADRTITLPDYSGTSSLADPVVGQVKKFSALNNSTNPNYQIDITSDAIVVENTSNVSLKIKTWSLTVDITVSGANGLDTGAEASSTWYYLWAIYDGTNKRGLLSTSSTAPTMPTGYTFKALVGIVFNDSGSNFVSFRQYDKNWYYNTPSLALNAGTAGVETAVSLTGITPQADIISNFRLYVKIVGTDVGGGVSQNHYIRVVTGGSIIYTVTLNGSTGGGSYSEAVLLDVPKVGASYYYETSVGAGANNGASHWVTGFTLY